ncbi:sterol desaturase family protein [Pedobacter punctiformis]|uniref:Sterol desaturase family protein n=1 Tax=Pedobacter punctiformis TaxID=3004097 RepID=A0ABT4L794_9SPHI|nr:sterol desaturase family protein [Pedobacter sp. HCMS5-2]MCZ4243557.1 sterol desaturase family protein [Pedobacter sp. HCMS5-2]
MKVDYIALSVPVFFILIGIEVAYNFYKKLNYYRLNDSISNLSQGIGQQLTGIFMKTALFFGYKYIFEHWRLFELPKTIWIWIILFIGVDFFYYWFHRMSHQVNALWAAHIVHHQSEEYNLTVALRQSWFQGWFSWVFYLPLALIGFDPLMFLTLSSFNTLYQFWIHTRAIKSMGILEYVLNTPSHHRVHHGSNPKYIDKNHAGTLIIWDRLFGTFQKEEEAVYYGITKPLASWNPVWANLHYWDDLVKTAKKSPRLSDKIKVFIMPPGWFPKHLGGFQQAPEIDENTYQKYNPKYQSKLTGYVFTQFLVALIIGSAILFSYNKMSILPLVSGIVFCLLTLTGCGALLEQKKWQVKFEYFRLLLGIVLVLLFKYPIGYQVIFVGIQLISLIWFFNLQKSNPDSNEN